MAFSIGRLSIRMAKLPIRFGILMKTAITKCEDVLADNPSAKVILYTDNDYVNPPKDVEVVHVYDRNEEWNVAILNAYAEIDRAFVRDNGIAVVRRLTGGGAAFSVPDL